MSKDDLSIPSVKNSEGGADKKAPKLPAGRYQNWRFLMYEESCNPYWKETLEESGVPTFAIRHDQDVWTEKDEHEDPRHVAGTHKKTHIQGVFMFAGKKSAAQALAFLQTLNPTMNTIAVCDSLPGACRYLMHLDNPTKYQYARSEVMSFCGADYDDKIKSEKQKLADEKKAEFAELGEVGLRIGKVVDLYRPQCFNDLVRILEAFNRDLAHYAVARSTYVSSQFCKSAQHDSDERWGRLKEYRMIDGKLYADDGTEVRNCFNEDGELLPWAEECLGLVKRESDEVVTPFRESEAVGVAVRRVIESDLSPEETALLTSFFQSREGRELVRELGKRGVEDGEQASSDSPSSDSEGDPFDDCPFPLGDDDE